MPNTVKEAIQKKQEGFHIGQRLVLPFRCQLIKMMAGGEIFTEFIGSKHVKVSQDPKNTSVYFRTAGKLDNMVGTYKVVKMIVCEWDADITDLDNHIKIICEMEDGHAVNLHEPSEDMLFIE
jgi:hypothetical protein